MNDETKQAINDTVEKTVEVAEETVQLPMVKKLARLGFYAKGVLFVVIGALAILLAAGSDEGKIADATGALAAIARKPFGKVLLIVFVAGAIGHGVWNILRGAADIDDAGKDWKGIVRRVISVGIGILYFGLAWTAWEIILAARVSAVNSQAEETLTSVLLAVPLGAVLLFLIGLGVIGAGCHECYSGISGKFQENYRLWEINGTHLSFITVLGVLSFTARALLLVIMGYFFVAAAVDGKTNSSIGMDAALLILVKSYFGRLLLFVTAIGLVSHGVLAFYEAKYRRIC